MRLSQAIAGAVLLGCGFLVGYWCRDARVVDGPALTRGNERATDVRSRGGGQRTRDAAARRAGGRQANGGRPRRERRWKDRGEALEAVRDALAAGDRHTAREALDHLARSGGEALEPEQLKELGALLTEVDSDLIHSLARALVVSGGAEGLAMVMGFVEDGEQPLDNRRNALEGLSHLPEEHVRAVTPVLADFLESEAARELQHAAARAFGRLHREGGVDALMGLLSDRPGVSADVVFGAVGGVGRPEDAGPLLDLLSGDWNRREKMSILRAAGELSARSAEAGGAGGSLLLDLMRETPEGVTRSMVAHAIEQSSHRLSSSVLREALAEAAGDRDAQEWIARALARSGGQQGLDTLMEAARNPALQLDERILARALTASQGSQAAPAMMDLFRTSREARVLEDLARGMVRSGDRETVDELMRVLQGDGDAWQRRAVARALEEAGGPTVDADQLLSMLRNERDQDVAMSIADALHRLHPRVVHERAVELFETSPSPVERMALARLLDKDASSSSLRRVAAQLRREPDQKAQWEMARILGGRGDEGVRHVADILQGEADERRRHSILWGLEASQRPGPPGTRQLFLRLASSDPAPSIRAQAAEILGRQADPALIPRLDSLLVSESNQEVQERIRQAIRELENRR